MLVSELPGVVSVIKAKKIYRFKLIFHYLLQQSTKIWNDLIFLSIFSGTKQRQNFGFWSLHEEIER